MFRAYYAFFDSLLIVFTILNTTGQAFTYVFVEDISRNVWQRHHVSKLKSSDYSKIKQRQRTKSNYCKGSLCVQMTSH